MLKYLAVILYCVGLFLSAANALFGLVSWCVLPKWRQFRHFVLISTLLTYPVSFAILLSVAAISLEHSKLLLGLFFMTFTHWLMVTTVMFYIEFVKIFTSLETIGHLYLKANTFGWLFPVVLTVLAEVSDMLQIIVCLEFIAIFTCNVVLYVCVLRALWRRSRERGAGQAAGAGVCTKLILSTFAFICTGALPTLPLYSTALLQSTLLAEDIAACSYMSTILFVNVFFLMLKSHRELWSEHWHRKQQAVLNAASIS